MRRTLIAGNWKMNGSLNANAALLRGLASAVTTNTDVAVCVPAPYLAQCQAALAGSPVGLGAQDLSMHANGAFTGEVSASMLQDFGCRFVIVGHSERRSYHGENSRTVALKAAAALAAGLIPIVCVGETLAERDARQTAAVVGAQLEAILDAIAVPDLPRLVVAYEPVWAIGTGKTATPEMAQEVHAQIRSRIALRSLQGAQSVQILYGGSMKPDNARQLLAMPDIDGGLIGGAALKVDDFNAISQAAG